MTQPKIFKRYSPGSYLLAAIAFLMITVWMAGFESGFVFAKETGIINITKTIAAPLDKVWNIVSDIDNNSEYWPIKDIKNINKSNITTERTVTVPGPPFLDNKAYQLLTINPKQSVIENQTSGPIKGIKILTLKPDSNPSTSSTEKTEINVLWNLDLSNVPGLGKVFAMNGINKSVQDALSKIEKASISNETL